MSVINNSIIAGAAGQAGGAAADYEISRSIRLNSPDSANLNRTPSTAGNRKTWTWAGWVKRTGLGSNSYLFESGAFDAADERFVIRFSSNNTLLVTRGLTADRVTSQVFRDTSAWGHLVVAVDTTQSTADDRIKIYYNGVQITDFSATVNPGLNDNTGVNNNVIHAIGTSNVDGGAYLNACLADIHLIDGQALDPTSFGEFDDNGVWQPIEFTPPATPNNGTTWSANASGTPYSGSYTWASAFDGSFATGAAGGVNTANEYKTSFTGVSFTTGVTVYGNSNTADLWLNGTQVFMTGATAVGSLYKKTFTSSDIGSSSFSEIGVDAGITIHAVEVDGVILIDGNTTNIGLNGFHLDFADNSSSFALGTDTSVTTPDPAPKGGMDVVTYTGNGSTQTIDKLQFQPDFVWIKCRSNGTNHVLQDTVRGITNKLASNGTYAENDSAQLGAGDGYVSTVTNNGFTVTNGSQTNQSSQTYVGWCWKAGGTAVTNTNGSVNSQVSANQDYGFSIVTWTSVVNTAHTFGHGLDTAPSMVFIKSRTNGSAHWQIGHTSIGWTKKLVLNPTAVSSADGGYWNNTAPTDTVVSIGDANGIGTDNVAYCWSEVAGFSKFGTYTGSGSTPVKITTGFKPRFILARPLDHPDGNRWNLIDTKRGVGAERLFAGDANFHGARQEVQILDDGFNVIDATPDSGSLNRNTQYIYAAFADNPGNDWDVNNISVTEGNGDYIEGQFSGTQRSGFPWYNVFDLNTTGDSSIPDASSTWTWTPTTPIPFSTLQIWCYKDGTPGDLEVNGTSVVSQVPNHNGLGLQLTTITGISSPLTSIKSISTGTLSNVPVGGIVIDGTLLIDNRFGYGNDSLRDSPTNGNTADDTGLGGQIPGNYCTMSPLVNRKDHEATFKNGNLEVTFADPQVYQVSYGTLAPTSGKWYFEVTAGTFAGNTELSVGVSTPNPPQGTSDLSDKLRVYQYNGNKRDNASGTAYGASWGSNAVIGCAFDLDSGTITYYKDGVSQGTAFTDLLTAMDPEGWVPYVYGFNVTYNVNFGQRAFAYQNVGVNRPSADFKALCTANLPDPDIADGSTAFEVITYQGNGTTQTLPNTDSTTSPQDPLKFSPDFVWIKGRSNSADHNGLFDIVRTATKWLSSNLTNSEITTSNSLTSFGTDEFTLGSYENFNYLNSTYVAWCWDGGTGSPVTDNNGSIQSTRLTNSSAGFSIVTYPGGAGEISVGHGLGVAPSFIICRPINNTSPWAIYHSSIGKDGGLNFSTSAAFSISNYWGTSGVTSTIFGAQNGNINNNGSSYNHVAYCFAPVEGYSAFGIYSNNNDANGPFVYTGFRPKYVLIKTTGTSSWVITDSQRSPFNVADNMLFAESSNLEGSDAIDFLSNGFKLRSASGDLNYTGRDYIYAAFAENPFKYARAR